jgi:hypothetical protein
MSESRQIEKRIIEMISTETKQRWRPYVVVRKLSEELGVPVSKIREALDNLIRKRKLVFTYRDPCSYVEFPVREDAIGGRSMKVVVDGNGNPWICDHEVDPSKDLSEQGCWQLEAGGLPESRVDGK